MTLLLKCSESYKVTRMERDFASEKAFMEQEQNQIIKQKDLAVQDAEIQKQNLISERKAKEILGGEVEKYKRLNSHVKAELKTVIKGLEAKYADTVFFMIDRPIIEPEDTNLIAVPKIFHYSDTWTSIDGTVKKNSVTIDSLSVVNKFDVTVGYKKDGFLKRSKPVVEIKSYNPYTTVPYVNNLVVQKPKSHPFTSKVAMAIYGLIAGFVIAK